MNRIVQAVRKIAGEGKLLLHEPLFIGNESKYVQQVLESGHISAGPWVDRFEQQLAQFIDARYAIAVMNGTCGLHAVITAMSKGEKKQYRIPALTFVATANAVTYGGNTIKFVEYDTYCDIAVDVLGHGAFNTGAPIRDAAQALGSKRYNEYVGRTGTAVFSFNQNKIITTGGGGMIVTDDEALAKEIKHLVTTARVNHRWETSHNAVAWNYRMSDMSAALGVAQLEQLPRILKAKRALAEAYMHAFEGMPGVKFWKEPEGAKSNYWLNSIILDDPDELEPTLEALHSNGIFARPLWQPIHQLPMYQDCERDPLTVTEDLYKRTICLPSSPKLGLVYA